MEPEPGRFTGEPRDGAGHKIGMACLLFWGRLRCLARRHPHQIHRRLRRHHPGLHLRPG